MTYRAAIITVSDSVAQGQREDLSGPAIARLLGEAGWTIQSAETVPDDFNLLRERLEALASNVDVDAVFTTGGTGVGPRDRTPEATTSVMERSLAGLAELMRREGMKKTPLAVLSRGVVGVRGNTVLVNLPGAPEGAADSLAAILEILPHAIAVLRGEAVHGQAAAEPETRAAVSEEKPASGDSPVTEGAESGDSESPEGQENTSALSELEPKSEPPTGE